jgi:DNA invertase Pin-like site-specific DNA recombinase
MRAHLFPRAHARLWHNGLYLKAYRLASSSLGLYQIKKVFYALLVMGILFVCDVGDTQTKGWGMQGTYIAYYRVSTKRQGDSGLGLEAQHTAVHSYLNGGDWTIAHEFVEIESGKSHVNRPQLQAAIDMCKKLKATLLIAKLDRLARNVHFVTGLIETKIKFIAVDMADADKTMLQIYAVMAERERDAIAQRTKSALAVAKAKGVKLGRAEENRQASKDFARSMAPIIAQLKVEGFTSVRKICAELNTRKVPTAYQKGTWSVQTTFALLKHIDANNL